MIISTVYKTFALAPCLSPAASSLAKMAAMTALHRASAVSGSLAPKGKGDDHELTGL